MVDKLLKKLNVFGLIRDFYYLVGDSFAERRQLLALGDGIKFLKKHNLLILISGPRPQRVEKIVGEAVSYGVDVIPLPEIPAHSTQGVTELQAKREGRDAGLALVSATDSETFPLVAEGVVNVLVLPPEKKYFKKMAAKLSVSALEAERKLYSRYSEKIPECQIVLNEDEAPRQAFGSIVSKLHSFVRLQALAKIDYPQKVLGLECFVIWGHGLKYQKEITQAIEREYDVLVLADKKIRNIKQFTREMYIEEMLKKGHHILRKNSHLAKFKRKAVLLLVRKKSTPDTFDCRGHGRANAVCDTFAQHFKQTIRDRYNPKKKSRERTEYHVIHMADTPAQVDNILRMFEVKPLIEWVNHG